MEMGNPWEIPGPCQGCHGKIIISLINLPDFGKNAGLDCKSGSFRVLTGVLCLRRLTSVTLPRGRRNDQVPRNLLVAQRFSTVVVLPQAVDDHFLTRSDRLEKRRRRKFQRRRAKRSQKCAPEAKKPNKYCCSWFDSEELLE